MNKRTKLPPIPPSTWTTSTRFPQTEGRPKHINHFGVSGGKDSTALLIWALHESGYPRESIDVTFCDTGNESPVTLQYIDYLEEALGIGITRIKPGLDFWQLAARKKRFPSAKARVCTSWLKIEPTLTYINAVFRAGHTMTLHSGVRASESSSRAKLLEREYDSRFLCEVYRPLHKLTISDVWHMHERYGVRPNPLYGLGMARVGCFPCCMSRKKEVARIAQVFPAAIDNIRDKEVNLFSDGEYHSFFAAKTCPDRFHSRSYLNRNGKRFTVATIDDIVAWARSAKGGKFDDRVFAELALEYDRLPDTEDAGMCPSTLGACE